MRRSAVSENPHLIVEREGHLLIVTMNRPEARNAFGAEMLVRMADAWTLADADDEIRVLDSHRRRRPFLRRQRFEGHGRRMEGRHLYALFQGRSHAGLEGAATALPFEKAAHRSGRGHGRRRGHRNLEGTDIRIAGQSAKFGVAEARRLGSFSAGGFTVRLRRQIPCTQAMEILLTAKHITAEEAVRIGSSAASCPTGKRSPRRARSPSRSPPMARSRCKPSNARSSRRKDCPSRGAEKGARDRLGGFPVGGRQGGTARFCRDETEFQGQVKCGFPTPRRCAIRRFTFR